jgi:transcriptional regulator of acetoin/glycerol metabolism
MRYWHPLTAEAIQELEAARVEQLEEAGMDHKAALKAAAREFGLSRSEAYRQLQIVSR